MHTLYLDLETRAPISVVDIGAYRYSEIAEIVILACARNDGPVYSWSIAEEHNVAIDLYETAVAEGWTIEAHNVDFEYAMLDACDFLTSPKIEQMACSAALCRKATIPHSLAGASKCLKTSVEKQAIGQSLIRTFSNQNNDGSYYGPDSEGERTVDGVKRSYRELWGMFVKYCEADVEAERQIAKKLKHFHFSETEMAGLRATIKINKQGIPINREPLNRAIDFVENEGGSLEDEFKNLTGLKRTQTVKLLKWFPEQGYDQKSLGANPRGLADRSAMTPLGLKALEMYEILAYSSVSKLKTIERRMSSDDRLRGEFSFWGARRTGRWASLGVNMQNLRRPTIENAELGYECFKADKDFKAQDAEYLFSASPQEFTASILRNFVEYTDDRMLLDYDYSNIELRVGAWIVGQEEQLELFRNDIDLYKMIASTIFGKPVEDITKDERFVGKVAALSSLFQSSARKLWQTCAAWGQPIDKEVAQQATDMFRSEYCEFPEAWRAYAESAKRAILKPNVKVKVDVAVPIFMEVITEDVPFPYMEISLPSGRKVYYAQPTITRVQQKYVHLVTGKVTHFESDSIRYINYSGVAGNRKATYGGDLFQTTVQAIAADIILSGCLKAINQGFEPIALVHDQILCEDGDSKGLQKAFCHKPEWLGEDFPLASTGGRVKRYSKD